MSNHRCHVCSAGVLSALSLLALVGACGGPGGGAPDPGIPDAGVPDASGPPNWAKHLAIISPKRGATLDGDPSIKVMGTAPAEVRSLTVNGIAVTPDPSGSFTYQVQASHGMNIVVVEGMDDAGGMERLVRSFYYAPTWAKPDPDNPESTLSGDAVVGWLGKPIFDNGDDPRTDLTTVVTAVVQDMIDSIRKQFPFTVRKDDKPKPCPYTEFSATNPRFGTPRVSIGLRSGELVIGVFIPNIRANGSVKTGKAKESWGIPNPANLTHCNKRFSASLKIASAEATAVVGISTSGGEIYPVTKSTDVQIKGVDINIENKVLGFLTNWLIDIFENKNPIPCGGGVPCFAPGGIAGVIESFMQEPLAGAMGSMFAGVLGSVAVDQTIHVPPFIGTGPGVEMRLLSRLQAFDPSAEGVRYAMTGTVVAPPVDGGYPSLGAVVRNWCGNEDASQFSLQDKGAHPLQVAVNDDLINQALYSLHQAGLLSGDLTDIEELKDDPLLAAANLEGTFDALLPPLFNTCTPDGQPLLQVGDLRATAQFELLGKQLEVQIHASVEAPVTLELFQPEDAGPERLRLAIADVTRIQVETRSLTAEGRETVKAIRETLERLLIPKLLSFIEDRTFSFPVPELDLHRMHPAVPAGTTIGLDLDSIGPRDGFTLAVGNIK